MGANGFTTWPVATYGLVLLLAGCGYYILVRTLIALHGPDSALATAIGRDRKGRISVAAYAAAIPLAFARVRARIKYEDRAQICGRLVRERPSESAGVAELRRGIRDRGAGQDASKMRCEGGGYSCAGP